MNKQQRIKAMIQAEQARGKTQRALRSALKRGMREAEQNIGALWVNHNRDCDKWAADIKKGLKKQYKYKAPDRGGMTVGTGQGAAIMRAIFSDPEEYWDDMSLFRKTKAFWDKWGSGESRKLFKASAASDYSDYSKWERMVGY